MNRELASHALAEAIGTFALTFVGAASICTDAYSGGQLGLVGVALAHGLVLAAVVSATGHVSGGHANPAVTLGALLVGAVDPLRAAVYVVAQLLGALVAGLFLTATFASDVWASVHLGAPSLGPGVAPGTGILIEMLLSFLLVLVVVQLAAAPRAPRHVHGLVIGATLAAAMLVGGPLTGAAINPARALGPAVAAGYWEAWYVWWVGPAMGAVMAAVVYGTFRAAERESGAEVEDE